MSALKKVFLTFDDGPSVPSTPRILDILKEFNVKASFFVCGKNAEKFPEITERIAKEGHTIGNHTFSHSFILTLSGLLIKEIEKTNDVIKKITGIETKFFRPPWGFLTPWLKKYLDKKNFKILFWDINSFDWTGLSYKIIEKRILKNVKSNSIILFHDGNGGKFFCNRLNTISLLPTLIKNLRESGYTLEKL